MLCDTAAKAIYFLHYYISVIAVRCVIVPAQRNCFEAIKNPRRRYGQRRIKKVESLLPAGNVFGGIWRSFSGAAYWMVCNSCLGVASPLAKPASTQSQ